VSASNENPTTDARIVALTGTVGISADAGPGNTGAGVMIGVNVIADTTEAYLSDTSYTNTNTNSSSNAASVQAKDNSWIVSLGFAIGGATSGNGIGGAISVNVIDNPVSAHLDNTQLATPGSLTVHAESDDTIGAGTVGGGFSGDG